MTTIEQRRAWVLTKVIAGEVEVAELLGLSVRSVWRLKRRFGDEGPAGLVHGNRGAEAEGIVLSRVSVRRILRAADQTTLADTFAEVNAPARDDTTEILITVEGHRGTAGRDVPQALADLKALVVRTRRRPSSGAPR
jgi:hypothetical protein